MIPGQPFFVVQLFDREGYYAHVKATSLDEVKIATWVRSARTSMIACSLPFPGAWSGKIPNISAPADWRQFLAPLEAGGAT
jgi:hypothetical protein